MKTIARTLGLLVFIAALILAPALAVRLLLPDKFVPIAMMWFGTLAFFLAVNYFIPFRKVAREIVVKLHRRTKLWVAILIPSLLIAPNLSARPDGGDDPTHEQELIAQGLCVLAVGGVVCWGIWKMCQKIPQPPAETIPPPPTNYPPVNVNPTRTNRPVLKMPKMETSAVNSHNARDISQFHMPDPVGGGEFHTYYFMRVEASETLNSWHESLTITGYVSNAGEYVGCWSNGACLCNAYITPGATDVCIPVEQGDGTERAKFFRAVVP